MVRLRDLYEGEEAKAQADKVDSRRIAIETFTLVVSVLTLLASVFGQAPVWFRWTAAGFAAVVVVWETAQLVPRGRALWTNYHERAALYKTVRMLQGELLDLLARFKRYTDNTRTDTIPLFLIRLGMDEKIELPVPDTSVYHIWRLYGAVRERISVVANAPSEFRLLAAEFGNLLELYHRLYVLPPYEKLRSMDISKLSPYGQTRVREELTVFREDYNDFVRVSNWFGTRVSDSFGENAFPAHLEALKPITV
jgi:hypothetical protein